MNLYWGELHCHSAISYGEGDIHTAFETGREHLDFVSAPGHASWHDEPEDDVRKEMHLTGFAKLKSRWTEIQRIVEEYNEPGRYTTILGHEWHSVAYGDHNVYFPDAKGPILYADDLAELQNKVRDYPGAILIAHMLGYAPGMRGVNWNALDEDVTPLVEIYSGHGCCESDSSPYPYYNEIGPRDHRTMLQAGLQMGKKVGVIASTDFHGGYPGNYGQGLTGVFADKLDREHLFEAFRARRTFAVTGDRIELDFRLNGVPMGSVAEPAAKRKLELGVRGWDRLDFVEVVKNGKPWKRWAPPWPPTTGGPAGRFLVRIEWGWGTRTKLDWKAKPTTWECGLNLNGGRIRKICPCFRVSPDIGPMRMPDGGLPPYDNAILEQEDSRVVWRSTTMPNQYIRVAGTSALVLEIETQNTEGCKLDLEMNGCKVSYTVKDLLAGSFAHSSTGKLRAPSFVVHGAIPESEYAMDFAADDGIDGTEDYYMVRVRQQNDQWAWSSPVWVPRP